MGTKMEFGQPKAINAQVVGRTSYQVQKLFVENKPDQVLKTTVTADIYTLPAAAPRA